jgi:hypothetical protein
LAASTNRIQYRKQQEEQEEESDAFPMAYTTTNLDCGIGRKIVDKIKKVTTGGSYQTKQKRKGERGMP